MAEFERSKKIRCNLLHLVTAPEKKKEKRFICSFPSRDTMSSLKDEPFHPFREHLHDAWMEILSYLSENDYHNCMKGSGFQASWKDYVLAVDVPMQYRGQYANGVRVGYWNFYHWNQKIAYTGSYDDAGRPHGEWYFYGSDGREKLHGSYKEGVRVGSWCASSSMSWGHDLIYRYNEFGVIIAVQTWVTGADVQGILKKSFEWSIVDPPSKRARLK